MSTPDPRFVVKICGITCQQDLVAAIEAGSNAIGFNFYRKSPRYVVPLEARRLETPAGCLRAGVFVNATLEELERAIEQANLDVVQLHGKLDLLPGRVRVWRSVPAGSPTPAEDARIEAYLLDTPTPAYGGSGKTFDWSIARTFPFRMIVAGGLDADTVAEAIAVLRPWGVDACSRLESASGRKDPLRVQAFVQNALRASGQLLKQEVSL